MKYDVRDSSLPSVELLRSELKRESYRKKFLSSMKSTFFTLVVVAAVAVLVATIWLPVLQIHGSSMTPTLNEGEIVVSVKTSSFEPGDLVGFYVGNKLLLKRYIAGPGQWVEIDESGNVYVDGEFLEEPYLQEKAFGNSDIEYPYQVPDNRIFCMGDHRETSLDSRNTAIGCISYDEILGKIVFRIWPFDMIGGF